jgi:hypothetical protein
VVQRVEKREVGSAGAAVVFDEGRFVVGAHAGRPLFLGTRRKLGERLTDARHARVAAAEQAEVARRRVAPRRQQRALQPPTQARKRLGELARREVGRRQILKEPQAQRVGGVQQGLAANQGRAHRLDAGLFHPIQSAHGLCALRRRMPHHPAQRAAFRRRLEFRGRPRLLDGVGSDGRLRSGGRLRGSGLLRLRRGQRRRRDERRRKQQRHGRKKRAHERRSASEVTRIGNPGAG